MKIIVGLFILVVMVAAWPGSRNSLDDASLCPPLADSLITLYQQVRPLAGQSKAGFIGLLESGERNRLNMEAVSRGFDDLGEYLDYMEAEFPDSDTLVFGGLRVEQGYARVEMLGHATPLGKETDRVRYSFLLFTQEEDEWRLVALNWFDKDRHDQYGTLLDFYETELSPTIRFPRLF